ncbi:hypothetical protein NSR52_004531 [Salmonella enterica]|nr:hypothetical protein [Salmonella enterica]EJW2026348.1 hypothetical protein [Salmonella enterica]EJW2102417.1 hypothetical protein [Salmonella enterica]
MKILIKFISISLLFLFIGCERDDTLSPPENSEIVSVIVQLPENIQLSPLRVMYRSNTCLQERENGGGEIYKRPGYNSKTMIFTHHENNNAYNLRIPKNGGGKCKWQLSNITFDIKLINNYGIKLSKNIPVHEIITFDKNSPQESVGIYKDIERDLYLTNDYFPAITNRHMNDNSKKLSLVRSEYSIIYRTHGAKKILFMPRVYVDKVIFAEEPIEHKIGKYLKVSYPDGTTVADGNYPDYKKLQSIIKFR